MITISLKISVVARDDEGSTELRDIEQGAGDNVREVIDQILQKVVYDPFK